MCQESEYNLTLHGILSGSESMVQLINQILIHPEIPPTTEGEECWRDRTNFKPRVRTTKYSPVCGRGNAIYKERWR